MSFELVIYIQAFASVIFALSFLLSFKMYKTVGANGSKYLKYFFVYNLAMVIDLSLFWISFNNLIPREVWQYFNLIAILFHFSYLSFFLIANFESSKTKKIGYKIYLFFLVLTVIAIIPELDRMTGQAFVAPHFCLVLFCSIYYYQVFQSNYTGNISGESEFWIVTGVFFCAVLTIPIMSVNYYLKTSLSLGTYFQIAIISFTAYVIMHLFFIKAFLCSKQPRI